MASWFEKSAAVIAGVHAALPDDAPLTDRTKAVDAAYPFGSREYYPYKAWLKARTAYLSRFGYQKRGKPIVESPLERMMRRAKS